MALYPRRAVVTRFIVPAPGPPAAPRVASRVAAGIEPEDIVWVWKGVWAFGKLSLVVGDPGCSKSTLVAAIAAHMTLGSPWPDGTECPSAEVLLIDAEDDPGDTIRPRLDAAGADPARVHILDGIDAPDGRRRSFRIEDVDALDQFLMEHSEVRLVVIDPLTAYLAGIDTHRNADVRSALAPIAALAAQRKVAVLAISHLNKGAQAQAIYRTSGSIGFVGIARSVHLVAKHPDRQGARVIVPIKNNLGPDTRGFAFDVELDGRGIPRARWCDEVVALTADELLSQPKSARVEPDRAAVWLQQALADGPRSAAELFETGKAEGLTAKRLRKALHQLSGSSKKDGFDEGWMWELPERMQLPE